MILIPVILALGTVIYGLTVASFAWEDLVFGVGVTAVLLAIFRKAVLPRPLPSSMRVITGLIAFPVFVVVEIREIITGTWQVATFVTGLRPLEHPGIVRIPLGRRSPVSEGLAGYVITVSPGTFLLGYDRESGEMLVHAIDASDPDAVRLAYERLFERYERRVVPPLPEGAGQ